MANNFQIRLKKKSNKQWEYVCQGAIEQSKDLDFLSEALQHKVSVLLNLSDVNYINSCGFGALVDETEHFKNAGLELTLCDLSAKVRHPLILLGSDVLLNFNDVTES